MFSQLFVAYIALATLAAATPTRRTSSPGNVCCETVTTASDPAAALLIKSLGITAQDVDALVGLTCTDVTVVGDSSTCGSSTTEVSCTDNSHAELISVGCVPVTTRRNNAPPASPGDVCCASTTTASDPAAAFLIKSLGITVQDVDALVGLTCTDVTVIGDSSTCGSSETKVSCTDNSHAELISVGCVPVTARRNNAPPPSPGNVCCASTSTAADPATAALLKSIGVTVQDVDALVGLDCTSVTVIGDSSTCGSSTTEVSCTDNSHAELVSVGCVPVTL